MLITKDHIILVTGAAGLLGATVVKNLLQNDFKVVATYHQREPSIAPHPQLTIQQLDLLDVVATGDLLQEVDAVIHCAGKVSFHSRDRMLLYKVNVEGTANLANAAIATSIKKFIHVSSVAALGRIRPGEMITEEMNWTAESSNSIYGHSKYLGEMELWRAMAEGLPAAIVNPTIIIGDGDWNEGSMKIFKSVYEEFPWYTEGATGFVDSRDVANAILTLLQSDVEDERFILSGHQETYKNIFFKIADALGKKRAHKKVTPFLAGLVWRWEKLKSRFSGEAPLVTKETTETAFAIASFDNSKFLKAFPKFEYTALDTTIKETAALLLKRNTVD